MIDSIDRFLPHDLPQALLLGRVLLPGTGPCIVMVKKGEVFDITSYVSTMAELLNRTDVHSFLRGIKEPLSLGPVTQLIKNSLSPQASSNKLHLLAPVDFQSIKACGVTFATSMIERVVEERCLGDASKAAEMRQLIEQQSGTDIGSIKPGSSAAQKVKESLLEKGLWSQYMEVGLGPDAEVFTKSQTMSAVGFGSEAGLHPRSDWNNPEPEVVVIVNNQGQILGATLGNDVNLRDFEGRSALLLGKAKDNNGSCILGPFIRLFDNTFNLDDIRSAQVSVEVTGKDGFHMQAVSDMGQISRDVTELVEQTYNPSHQYPDGFALFLGTLFAPVQDRDHPGQGFTHKLGDVVEICSPKLGGLHNRINHSDKIPQWNFGILELIRNLKQRQLL